MNRSSAKKIVIKLSFIILVLSTSTADCHFFRSRISILLDAYSDFVETVGNLEISRDDIAGKTDLIHYNQSFKSILDQVEKNQERISDIRRTVAEYHLGNRIVSLENNILYIDELFNRLKHWRSMSDKELRELADTITSYDITGVHKKMSDMTFIITEGGKSIFEAMRITMEYENTLSGKYLLSDQQLLYTAFRRYIDAEIKGFILSTSAWEILQQLGLGTYEYELKSCREIFERQVRSIQERFYKAINRSRDIIWRNDPSRHVDGETYLEIVRLLQGYIIDSTDLNTSTCKANFNGNEPRCRGLFPCHDPCKGQVYECAALPKNIRYCKANKTSTRRYEYFESSAGGFYEKYGNGTAPCQKVGLGEFQFANRIDPSLLALFGTTPQQEHEQCFCLCDDTKDRFLTLRYFSLRPTYLYSDEVITGVRFIRRNKIIHLQVQVGEYYYGVVDARSVYWKEPDNFRVDNSYEGIDYFKLDWNNRSLDLDDVMAPPGHVVTGLQMRHVRNHLFLELKVTKILNETGKLTSESRWISMSTPNQTKIDINNLDVSTVSRYKSIPLWSRNKFITFRPSSYQKDAAQTTIPFLDAQPTYTRVPMPLSGIGLYYKRRDGYGGFVAPRLFVHIQATNMSFYRELEDFLYELEHPSIPALYIVIIVILSLILIAIPIIAFYRYWSNRFKKLEIQ